MDEGSRPLIRPKLEEGSGAHTGQAKDAGPPVHTITVFGQSPDSPRRNQLHYSLP